MCAHFEARLKWLQAQLVGRSPQPPLVIFAKESVCLLASSKGVAQLIGVENHRPYVAPMSLLMMAFASIAFKSMMETFSFLKVFPYYVFPFVIILPLLLCIVAEIRSLMKSKKGKDGAVPNPSQI